MKEITRFVAAIAERHPEVRRQLHWRDVQTIARREGVSVRRVPLSHPGRLVRFGRQWEIQVNEDLDQSARAVVGVHELVHYWRDREDEPAIYSTDLWMPDPREDFANLVAWYLTTPHRPDLPAEGSP